MKNQFKKASILLVAAMQVAVATNTWAQKSPQELPPLIQRELFFDNPEIAGSQLSPDGKMVSFLKANNGILNIWVKAFDEPFDKARPLTASEEPIGNYFWTDDGKYILFTQSKGGDENDNIYAVDPKAKADATTGIPAARNLTPNDNVKAYIYAVSRKNPDVLWIGMNDRDASWHDLYKLEISTGKLMLLEENKSRLAAWMFDWDENIRMAMRSPEDGSTELLRREKDGSYTKVYECAALESCAPLNFSKDNKSVYIETNKGSDVNLSKVVLMDLNTLKITDAEKDPLNKADFGNALFSDKTHEMLFTTYTDAKTRVYYKDKDLEKDVAFIKAKFPGMDMHYNSFTKDEEKFLFAVSSDTKLPEVYFFDRKKKDMVFQYTPRPKLKPYEKYFGEMQPITYKSSDDLEIPAYLTLPKGWDAKNLPLVVVPHGGPWARNYWGFDGFAQWLANRGYAVLQINFRGSTGYGKKFLDAGNKQWGMLMQDDITWGVKHLVDNGTVDPKRVAIMGGSYGGYATLAGLAFTPDLYAAGVDIVGPSNLITLLNSIPAYWEAGRKIFTIRMGDPETPEGKALLEKQSPLNSAAKIKAPLMIIQGANDPRVKKAESDQIAIAMRELGRPIVYLNAPDEGHGYHKPVNNMAAFAKAEEFIGKNLNVRYEKDMTPEVAAKLKDLTVDVASLSMPKKLDVVADKYFPKPAPGMKEGSYNYAVTLEMGGQKIPMTMTRSIKQKDGKWIVTDAVKSPMGEQSDEGTFNGESLLPMSRSVSAGGNVVATYAYQPGKVTTTIQGKANDVTVDGAYLPDGAGNDVVLAHWPLKEGYQAGFYVAGQDGKATLNKFAVIGTETVNGAICYKCTLTNVDDVSDVTTFYINTADKMTYKMEAPIAQMPGAKMTIELQK